VRRSTNAVGVVVKLGVNDNTVPWWVQAIVAVFGIALSATGAVAVFVTDNSVGSASLVVAGAAALLLAVVVNRVRSFEGGGLKFELAEAAVSKLAAAEAAERDGRGPEAELLRDQASLLISAAEPIAGQYEYLRRDRPGGWDRTLELEQLVSKATTLVGSYPDVTAVEKLFNTGREGNRISAIAIMEVNPAVVSSRVCAAAIRSPMSNFEQWHALKVAEMMLAFGGASKADLAEVLAAVEDIFNNDGFGADGADRRRLAQRILARSR
jgi:hypothetical protein